MPTGRRHASLCYGLATKAHTTQALHYHIVSVELYVCQSLPFRGRSQANCRPSWFVSVVSCEAAGAYHQLHAGLPSSGLHTYESLQLQTLV